MKPAPPAYLTEVDEAQDHEIITEPVISEAEFLEAQAQMIELEALEAILPACGRLTVRTQLSLILMCSQR